MAPENKISLKMLDSKNVLKNRPKAVLKLFYLQKYKQKFVTDRKIVTFSIHNGT